MSFLFSTWLLGSCVRFSSCSPWRESGACPLYLAVSCSVFAAKSAGMLDLSVPRSCRQRQLYALVWFCWCRRTSRHVPFF